ncbi:hypothetical protein ISN45_Aa03g034340 [Arabidopsis thaliana x Arabidopsis arenosa]|uniref:Uncharacterized protein n=1 Tax=Arabidopsis thaliana x Arabidopsis arenosa TaxID=1240361 RepID=A0A8T2AYS0_9BRAS|nr:hypothetical protein ISN45_Aa03g034340 [Arabidopsis thaliana x Arabidopsis arenosa]
MVIKRIELCIEITKIAMEFLVVVADAVTIFLRQSSPPPPALLRHGQYSYSASLNRPSSHYVIGFLP